jgi:hypothetical protein
MLELLERGMMVHGPSRKMNDAAGVRLAPMREQGNPVSRNFVKCGEPGPPGDEGSEWGQGNRGGIVEKTRIDMISQNG